MDRTQKHLSTAAVATLVALGGPAMMAFGAPSPASTAEITVDDCVVESSKDISYVEYLADGEAVAKDEDVDAETFTLSGIEGIEEFDAVEVKSGTTVETFSVSCPAVAPVTTIAGEPEDEADTEGSDDETEAEADEETEAEDTDDETDDGAEVADDEGDHRWASAGVNGHGEDDERHDGRHERWGGTADDDAEEESDDSDDGESSDEVEAEDEESDDQGEDVEEEVDDSDAGDDEDDEDDEDDDES